MADHILGFNEAGARGPGKPWFRFGMVPEVPDFNEAGARGPGKRAVMPGANPAGVTSMRPGREAPENLVMP